MATNVYELMHERSNTFVEEHVDQFSAYAISWNDNEAIHVTFGRNSIRVNSETIVHEDDAPARLQGGQILPVMLDVSALSMPIETAQRLGETLLAMVEQAKARESGRE